LISRPEPSEYAPYCAKYIALVPDGNFRTALDNNTNDLWTLLKVAEPLARFRYALGKWTVSEMILHVADVERIQSCRALRFARGETQALPGFDPASYVAVSRANDRDWGSVSEEMMAVREATLALFQNLPDEAWTRCGIADGFPLSVRAAAYVIAGHAIHHCTLLRERYLSSQPN
jgi:hypothetical protein